MSLFDLSSYVGTLSPSTATITRYNSSFASTGKAAAKTVASTTTAAVSFQPKGKQWDRTMEGFTPSQDRWSVFAQVELRLGDRITVGGVAYEIEHAEPWNALGGYWEATAKALDATET